MSTIKVVCINGRHATLTIDSEPIKDAVRVWLEVGVGAPPVITVEEDMHNGERTTRHHLASFTLEAEQS